MQGEEKGAGDAGGEEGDAMALAVALPFVLPTGRISAVENDTAGTGQKAVGRGRSVPRDEEGGRNGQGWVLAIDDAERVPRGDEKAAIIIKSGSNETRGVGNRDESTGEDVGRGEGIERGRGIFQESVMATVVEDDGGTVIAMENSDFLTSLLVITPTQGKEGKDGSRDTYQAQSDGTPIGKISRREGQQEEEKKHVDGGGVNVEDVVVNGLELLETEEKALINKGDNRGEILTHGNRENEQKYTAVKKKGAQGNGNEVDEDAGDVYRVEIVSREGNNRELGSQADAKSVVYPPPKTRPPSGKTRERGIKQDDTHVSSVRHLETDRV